MTPEERRLFARDEVTLSIDHPAYGHQAVLSAATRDALAEDFA